MTDHDALIAAIVASPEEDTPRLMYADWLEENAESKLVACPKCRGKRRVQRGYCDAFMYGCDEFGDDNCEHKNELVTCYACDGTGTLPDSPRADRAAIIRVQCELAKVDAKATAHSEPWASLRKREHDLCTKHWDAWSKWPCPACPLEGKRHVTCSLCGNSGDLFHGSAVKLRRGFPDLVTVLTLDTLATRICCDENCPGPDRWQPTPRLLACSEHTPVRRYLADDRTPVTVRGAGMNWSVRVPAGCAYWCDIGKYRLGSEGLSYRHWLPGEIAKHMTGTFVQPLVYQDAVSAQDDLGRGIYLFARAAVEAAQQKKGAPDA